MKQITEAIREFLSPFFVSAPILVRNISLALLPVFYLSALVFLYMFFLSCFIMAMNPSGNRHWRHMTPRMYGLLFAFGVVEVVLILSGVWVMDFLVVVGPLMMGVLGCLVPFCMRKSESEGGKVRLEDGVRKGDERV